MKMGKMMENMDQVMTDMAGLIMQGIMSTVPAAIQEGRGKEASAKGATPEGHQHQH